MAPWRTLPCQSSGRPRTFLATQANVTGIDMNSYDSPKIPEKPKEVPFQGVTTTPLPNWNTTVPVNCLGLSHFDKFSECVRFALMLLLSYFHYFYLFRTVVLLCIHRAMPAAQHREGLAASCLTLKLSIGSSLVLVYCLAFQYCSRILPNLRRNPARSSEIFMKGGPNLSITWPNWPSETLLSSCHQQELGSKP